MHILLFVPYDKSTVLKKQQLVPDTAALSPDLL